MAKSLYLINPRNHMPSYFGIEVFENWGLTPAQSIADLATTTTAALAPSDWEIEICEEFVQEVDLDHPADFIGLTGKITQSPRMLELADEFRRRGKKVIIGGPCASLTPEMFRGRCDVLVAGELEPIAEELFAALDDGSYEAEYVIEEKPELTTSPVPRWDLYPNDRAVMGCVQTSRGCPFECEFCDVIQYLGRKQRHKSVEQIVTELDLLYGLGYRQVFLADDNFTVYRKRAKEVLAALADWNRGREEPMEFSTQVSIDAARDPEIMQGCAEAGMTWVFIGIETPNEESLKETKKRQNVGVDLGEQIQVFLDHGIQVTGGMIVGFDHDGADIFERQFEFAMSVPVPMFSLGALVAPAATPLMDRIRDSGRLTEQDTHHAPWKTNIAPVLMSQDELEHGVKRLCNRLYSPENFGKRVVQLIERMGPQRGPFEFWNSNGASRRPRGVERQAVQVLKKVIRQGPEERQMWRTITEALAKRPDCQAHVMQALLRYAQVRCLYEHGGVWEPHFSDQVDVSSAPPSAGPVSGGLIQLGG